MHDNITPKLNLLHTQVEYSDMQMKEGILWIIIICLTVSCQTKYVSEAQRFEASVRKELPFRIDSLQWVEGTETSTFRFANKEYVSTPPDAEISIDEGLSVYRTFIPEQPSRQRLDKIWRNVVVSKKNRRVICIDRYLKQGKTEGWIYVMQSESEKYPTYGTYHWDVSDSHNIESVGGVLDGLRKIALQRLIGNKR